MSDCIDSILGSMTLEHKIGQMLCYGFCGTYPYPDIMEMISRYHVAGFRVTPYARKFQRYFGPNHPGTPRVVRPPQINERFMPSSAGPTRLMASEYAKVLNTLRLRSLETGAGVPLYFSLDFEGNGSGDFLAPGMLSFPHPMGLTASGDPTLCRRVGWVTGRQLKAVGIDWVHSPDVDVNTDPSNPEIGTRAYSPHPDVTGEYALQTILGYRDGNLVATAKHFPGRGHSATDAHFDVPTINESAQRMRDVHLAPYRKLIANGLPAIMLAHSVYPSLDPSNEISTVSKPIVTGVLREELGFDGVIITDSFTMGGLVARYDVAEAVIRSFEAGVDLLLLKDENSLRGEVFEALVQAVKTKRLSEARVEASVRRVLKVKKDYGLLDGDMGIVDPEAAEATIRDVRHYDIANESARKSVVVLRDDARLIPLPRKRVLVVEQAAGIHYRHANSHAHVGALWEALLERGCDAMYTDYDRANFDKAWPIIQERASHADVIVHTGYYGRGSDPKREQFEQIEGLGKPTVFVGNSPYPEIILPQMRTVIVTFSPTADSMRMVADILTGRAAPTTKLGFDPTKVY